MGIYELNYRASDKSHAESRQYFANDYDDAVEQSAYWLNITGELTGAKLQFLTVSKVRDMAIVNGQLCYC